MEEEEREQKVFDKLDELTWQDERIPEIMEVFFNTPCDACAKAEGAMLNEHIDSLFSLLEIDE